MIYLEYALWVYFFAYPLYIFLTYEKEKQQIIAQPQKRVGAYRETMAGLWLPTFVLLALVFNGNVSGFDIGIRWQWDLANQIGTGLLIVLCGYFVMSLKQLDNDSKARKGAEEQLEHLRYFMPTNNKERRYFTFGVSVAAGVCEELLYRGFMMTALGQYMPTWAAVVLSSLIFGLGHVYQGYSHILRTAMMGVVMALIYLATDSLLIPILFHIAVDVYSGALGYTVFSKHSNTQQPAAATA